MIIYSPNYYKYQDMIKKKRLLKSEFNGFIYIRENPIWKLQRILKLGCTHNIKDRDQQYITYEPNRGIFSKVIGINEEDIKIVEKKLHKYFKKYHYEGDGGSEFFSSIIFNKIEKVLDEFGIDYHVLTHDEINALTRSEKEPNTNEINKYTKDTNSIKLPYKNSYQEEIINKAHKYYSVHDNGRLYMACGTGKTLMGFFIATIVLSAKKIFIAVPSLYLLTSVYNVWNEQLACRNEKFHYLLIGSDSNIQPKSNVFITTNMSEIMRYLKTYNSVVVITTYQSSAKLSKAIKNTKVVIDLGIYDEAHRTTCFKEKENINRELVLMENKLIKKKLFLTATEKIFKEKYIEHDNTNQKYKILSMDDVYVYGEVIYLYNTKKAIHDNRLSDYLIDVPLITTDIIRDYQNKYPYIKIKNKGYNINIIIKAILIVELFEKKQIKHLLTFSNNRETAKNIFDIIELIIKKKSIDVKNFYLDGEHSVLYREQVVKQFEKSKYSIINTCKIFNEGVDIPICDSVFFVDIKQSEIEIVQCLGRCLRLHSTKKDKSRIVMPIMMEDVLSNQNFFEFHTNSIFQQMKSVLKTLNCSDNEIPTKIFFRNLSNNNLTDLTSINDDTTTKTIIVNGKKININKLLDSVLTKTFKSNGKPYDLVKHRLNKLNRIHFNNDNINKFICTKESITEYFRKYYRNNKWNPEEYIHSKLFNINTVKYALGNELFELVKSQYWNYDKVESVLRGLCCKYSNNRIVIDKWKKKEKSNERCPPLEWMSEGLYDKKINDFNLHKYRDKNKIEFF